MVDPRAAVKEAILELEGVLPDIVRETCGIGPLRSTELPRECCRHLRDLIQMGTDELPSLSVIAYVRIEPTIRLHRSLLPNIKRFQ